jgi:hypothetical protein
MENTDTLLDVSKKVHIKANAENTKYLLTSRQQIKDKNII